jgi:antitoxin ChpS
MYITNFRKVDGSIVLTIPTSLFDELHLEADTKVALTVDNRRLIVTPSTKPYYTLDELLAQCEPPGELSAEEREWLDAPVVGREII